MGSLNSEGSPGVKSQSQDDFTTFVGKGLLPTPFVEKGFSRYPCGRNFATLVEGGFANSLWKELQAIS
ncbi:hypothetical protein RRG08_003308 [Elysia crispata]|uniref:Uncharacterized protein n=1 Tax=Elysia crispata TaxID=231223 RepID=A0AAE0ZT03_9GAST|nr:hypothetical protein RRG08_003308 [Elysia crispata]